MLVTTDLGLSILFVIRARETENGRAYRQSERVVASVLSSDPPCSSMIVFDLEGEFFWRRTRTRPTLDELQRRHPARHTFHCAALEANAQSRRGLPRTNRTFLEGCGEERNYVLLAGYGRISCNDHAASLSGMVHTGPYIPEEARTMILIPATLKAVRNAYQLLAKTTNAITAGNRNRLKTERSTSIICLRLCGPRLSLQPARRGASRTRRMLACKPFSVRRSIGAGQSPDVNSMHHLGVRARTQFRHIGGFRELQKIVARLVARLKARKRIGLAPPSLLRDACVRGPAGKTARDVSRCFLFGAHDAFPYARKWRLNGR